MCGIAGILQIKTQTEALRSKALGMSRTIRHRGPDWSGIYCGQSVVLAGRGDPPGVVGPEHAELVRSLLQLVRCRRVRGRGLRSYERSPNALLSLA